jgi:hypothetical protein
MSDLTQFRDHCLRMADGKPLHYRNVHGVQVLYVATPEQAELWSRLADEVDRYLELPALPSDEDHESLFGESA